MKHIKLFEDFLNEARMSAAQSWLTDYFNAVMTNAESNYCFITEKTTKPIMNLHPFVVLGNPHTLKVLKK